MKRSNKVIFNIKSLLILALFVALSIFYQHKSDGFTLWQITSSLPYSSKFDISYSNEKKERVRDILNQPFYYLGKGAQSYAFTSEDGMYVLKFFKHKHLKRFIWRWGVKERVKIHQKRADDLFASYKFAYEKFEEDTGLIFLQLNRQKNLNMHVFIFDKLGIKHCIDLDKYEFIVQKRGLSVYDAIRSTSSCNEFKLRIRQLIDLLLLRYEKGVGDMDHSFTQNVAFCPDVSRAFFIDPGKFYSNDKILQEEEQKRDFEMRMKDLLGWVSKHFPQHVPEAEEVIKSALNNK